MFDIDNFVDECLAARSEADPRRAIKAVLERAIARPEEVAAALPATQAEVVPLHASDGLSVLKAVWAPGMSFRPHNHLMWATIGIYGGQEDNTFYRRASGGLVESGGKQLRTGDVVQLGDDTIHSVANPLACFTGAIHVYGGDITQRPGRSEWDEETGEEIDYDFQRTREYFEAQNTTE